VTGPARTDPGASTLADPLTVLAGIGPAKAELLARLGLRTLRDLALLVPRRLERRAELCTTAAARERVGEPVTLRGTIGSVRSFRRGRGRGVVRGRVQDDAGTLDAVFFNQPWMRDHLVELADRGAVVELEGSVVETRSGPALATPRLGTEEKPLPPLGSVRPLYPLTDGVGQEFLGKLVARVVDERADELVEPLPSDWLAEQRLPALPDAARTLVAPADEPTWHHARRRVALESLLALQARLASRRAGDAGGAARPIPLDAHARERLLARLPFRPTAGQRRAMEEVARDLARRAPMRRLLQGDVGSGKTLVALFACLAAVEVGGQAVLLAPTEVLAEQHFAGLAPLLASTGLATPGHAAVLLTGSLRPAERRRVLASLADGTARFAVGTHALFSDDVRYARLDLAVIDEQQRFGVAQRQRLLDKGRDVHVLLSTATPIPRTLALTLYGDLDTSVVRDAPPGRGTRRTYLAGPDARERVEALAARRVAAGERVFWVCPRIGDDLAEVDEGAAAERAFARLSGRPCAEHGVELVHGRVDPGERGRRIDRFRSGRTRLLVGTTLVEVGVDVPEATLMVVEGAERLGLAQLHQLRGRVGRGPRDATCVLLADDSAAERLEVLTRTEDGFEIAEEDLRRRGMGDLAGVRQAGENAEGLADPAADLDLILFAHRAVRDDDELRRVYLERG
jgi:ATP-dependent DNA helicase RecG